jgi:hypothetical protein
MQPVFVRVNQSLNFTLEYYNIGRIKDHMFRFAGKLNLDYLDTYYDLTFTFHSQMEDEIHQVMQTNDGVTQVIFFENLKEWLSDWRIEKVNKDIILDLIEKYNENCYSDFLQEGTFGLGRLLTLIQNLLFHGM